MGEQMLVNVLGKEAVPRRLAVGAQILARQENVITLSHKSPLVCNDELSFPLTRIKPASVRRRRICSGPHESTTLKVRAAAAQIKPHLGRMTLTAGRRVERGRTRCGRLAHELVEHGFLQQARRQ